LNVADSEDLPGPEDRFRDALSADATPERWLRAVARVVFEAELLRS
jgi:hypothetical protein